MHVRFIMGAAVLALSGLASAAFADDQPFITVYTTDIETQGGREFEQSLIWATQKPHQAFQNILSRSEIEYGITDDFQVSLYGNTEWAWSRLHAPRGPADGSTNFNISGEAIWRLLNVYFDPLGVALYLEPSYGARERELEAKLLLQKNFFNDDLRIAANFNFENRWERESDRWNKASAIEAFVGVAYNITPELSVGAEFNNENGFEGLVGGAHPESNAYYLGPTIHYEGHPFKVTAGFEAQLPWAEDPSHTPGSLRGGYLADAERYRVGFRIATDF